MEQHGNSGLHCKSLVFWESGGSSTTVIGTLPAPVSRAINGLFQVVYRMSKRGSTPSPTRGDAEALLLSGGTVTTAYHSPFSVRQIVHAIAAPIRFLEGQAIETSLFFALASGSSTDRSANKHELVYTRTLREGQVCTAFLGLWELRDGTAPSIVTAYNQTMLKAGLPIEKWVSRMFWYCADGAEVMQSTGNGVAALLMQPEAEVLGYSVVVPMHANSHRADLAFRDAMDSSHVFLHIVSEGMTSVTGWFKNTPTRLRNLSTMAVSMGMSPLRYGCLSQRRWAAFAARAVRAFLRTYVAMVCTLFVARSSRKRDKEQRQQLLMIVTNFVFAASLHFLQDFT